MQPGINHRARSALQAQHKQTLTKNSSQIIGRLPPYGKELVARQQFNNLPFAVVVCVGAGAWNRAKQWKKQADIAPLVLPDGESPERYQWPVMRCLCMVDWNTGPADALIIQLVQCLLRAGALSVTIRPLFVDHSAPAWEYSNGQWRQTREMIKTYYPPRREVRLVA